MDSSSADREILPRREETLALLIDAVKDYAIFMLDAEGRVASWNQGAQRIKGYREEEVIGQSYAIFFTPEDIARGKPNELLRRAREVGKTTDQGWRVRKGGNRFLAEVSMAPIWDKGGLLRGYAKVTRDVTEREALKEMRTSEKHFHERKALAEEVIRSRHQLDVILQGVDNPITAQEPSGRLIFANQAAARFLGYDDVPALMAAPIEEAAANFNILDEAGHPVALELRPGRRALRGENSPSMILRYRHKRSGDERWCIVRASAIRDSAGRPIMAVSFFQDITGLKARELEERKAKEQLRIILEGINDAIIAQAPDERVLFINEAAARLFGFASAEIAYAAERTPRAEEMRRNLTIVDEDGKPLPPEEFPGRQAMEGKILPSRVLRLRADKNGPEHWVVARATPVFDDDGEVLFTIQILHDITQVREAEERFRQSQKMEAVGRLAGGIAHDFNNLLTAINGYSELAIAQLSLKGEAEPYANLLEVREAGKRAAALTQQLLAFSRKQILAPRILDLNEVVQRMNAMLRRVIGEDVQLEMRLAPGLAKVRVDVSQMEQVIMNLAVNARDAMPEGGWLTMETADVELDGGYASTHLEVSPGPHVMLAISDTGVGMDERVRSKIFEPFFTTKEAGKGTGLGLATVYGIVKQSGGNIHVNSEPGRGSAFRIYLPAVQGDAGEEENAPAPVPRAAGADSGDTILVVEDEDSVRNLVRQILAEGGYACLPAETGEAALALMREHPGAIHLLLTDVVLRGMSGLVLAEKLKAIQPSLRVLFMSGYADNAVLQKGLRKGGMELLHKPFSAQALLHRVGSLLHAPA